MRLTIIALFLSLAGSINANAQNSINLSLSNSNGTNSQTQYWTLNGVNGGVWMIYDSEGNEVMEITNLVVAVSNITLNGQAVVRWNEWHDELNRVQDNDGQGDRIATHMVVIFRDAMGVPLKTLHDVDDHVRSCGSVLDVGDSGGRLTFEVGQIQAVTIYYLFSTQFHC
jgi:hypothetical protein